MVEDAGGTAAVRHPSGPRRRRDAVVALIGVVLLLLAVPPAVAGQPGPLRRGEQGPVEAAAPASTAPALPPAGEGTGETGSRPPDAAAAETDPTEDETGAPSRSARPRGRQAPMPPAAAEARAGPDPDAEAPEERSTERRRTDGRDRADRDRDRTDEEEPMRRREEPSGERVWPLRPEDFDFTQAFGCVPQIGGFYSVTPGCPDEAPGFHTGIDLAAPTGTRFYAAASGWVREAGLDREVGPANTRIVIQHDGPNADYATEYLHWITTYVEPGDHVRAGQPIGEVGSVGYSTGPHLHFSVIDFETGEHADPSSWLPRDRGNGSYLGLAPGSRETSFDDAPSRAVPDYADPAPPPAPRRERVPASPRPTDRPAERATAPGAEEAAAPGGDDAPGRDEPDDRGEGEGERGRTDQAKGRDRRDAAGAERSGDEGTDGAPTDDAGTGKERRSGTEDGEREPSGRRGNDDRVGGAEGEGGDEAGNRESGEGDRTATREEDPPPADPSPRDDEPAAEEADRDPDRRDDGGGDQEGDGQGDRREGDGGGQDRGAGGDEETEQDRDGDA